MAYCPQCGTEYAEGSRECIDCGSALLPGAPPPSSLETKGESQNSNVKLVTVHIFNGPTAGIAAELGKNWLESEGIPCVLAGANAARIYPIFNVPLMVREEDAEEATQILKDYLDSSQLAGEDST